MGSLLVTVKTKMAIYAHEKVRGILEGEYGSVFKGRSMDFDDLREYVPGDDIKDIDWKSTARSGATRIRRYVAIRKHNVMLVVDSGLTMTAVTKDGTAKKDIVVLLAGVIGALVLNHGDFIGMVAGDKTKTSYHPLRSDTIHLEKLLQSLDKTINAEAGNSDLASQLLFVAKNVRRKMIIVVISDLPVFDEQLTSAVRRLRAQHEILWLHVGDADVTVDTPITDVEAPDALLPAFIRTDETVAKAFHEAEQKQRTDAAKFLNRLAISSELVESEEEAVTKVFHLLEKHRGARHA